MKSLGKCIIDYVGHLSPQEQMRMHVARRNDCFEQSVRTAFAKNPGIAEFILANVCSIYVEKEFSPTADKTGQIPKTLVVCMDDSAARSELDNHQAFIIIELKKHGYHYDKIKDIPAMRSMRQRRVFPNTGLDKLGENSTSPEPEQEATQTKQEEKYEQDQKANFKRAVCKSFETLEQAETFLSLIEYFRLDPDFFANDSRRGFTRQCCTLYSSRPDLLNSVLDKRQRETIISKARHLGLHISNIMVNETPEEYRGKQAFPHYMEATEVQ